jgi:AcrR family transcriptional regulator
MKIETSKNEFSILSESGISSKERLLKSAGVLFAAKGFREVSVREIAAHAGVNSALVGYYFRGKQALFNEVYRAHAAPLAQERLRRLAEISKKDRQPSVEEILKAWLIPWLQIESGHGESIQHVRFMANLSDERWEHTEKASSFTNRANQAFIKALHRSLPHLSKETVMWRLHFLVGAVVFGIRIPGPLKAISKGKCDPHELQAAFEQILPYTVAGFCAPEPDVRNSQKNPDKPETSSLFEQHTLDKIDA